MNSSRKVHSIRVTPSLRFPSMGLVKPEDRNDNEFCFTMTIDGTRVRGIAMHPVLWLWNGHFRKVLIKYDDKKGPCDENLNVEIFSEIYANWGNRCFLFSSVNGGEKDRVTKAVTNIVHGYFTRAAEPGDPKRAWKEAGIVLIAVAFRQAVN